MNFFELFGLPVIFDVDMVSLKQRFHKLQQATHPDKFVLATDQERRVAMQKVTQVNEGFQILKNPILRAQHLLQIKGIENPPQAKTINDPQFLLQQMTWRESLEDSRSQSDPFAVIANLIDEISKETVKLETVINDYFKDDQLEPVAEIISKLQFFHKLKQEAESIEADLEDQL